MGTDNFGDDQSSNQPAVIGITETADSSRDSGSGEDYNTKHRGRPKGSKNKPKSGNFGRTLNPTSRSDFSETENDNRTKNTAAGTTPEETVSVQEQKPRKRRKVTPKTIENPGEVASAALDYIETAAVHFIGNEAKFDPFERFLLEVGARDTAGRVSPETMERVVSIVSPVCLIAGIALYTFRMTKVVASRIEHEQNQDIPGKTFTEDDLAVNNPANGFRIADTIVPPQINLRVE